MAVNVGKKPVRAKVTKKVAAVNVGKKPARTTKVTKDSNGRKHDDLGRFA